MTGIASSPAAFRNDNKGCHARKGCHCERREAISRRFRSARREDRAADPFALVEAGMGEDTSEKRPPIGGGIDVGGDGGGDAAREPRPGGVMPTLVVAAIAIAGLYFARPVLQPLAVAVLLALLLAPAVRWLHQHGLGRAPAVLVTVFSAFVVIVGFAAAVGEEFISLAQKLPQYEDNIATKIRSLNGVVPGASVLGRATAVFRHLGDELAPAGPAGIAPASEARGAPGDPRIPVPVEIRTREPARFQLLQDIAGPVLLPLASSGLVLLCVVMILLKREDLRDRLIRLGGARDLHRTTAAMNEAAERVSRYLLMQLGVGICYGVPVAIGLAIIGIPNAPLWGIIGVVLRFIPSLGGALTAAVPIALAIAVAPGWDLLVWTVLMFAGIELVFANVVEPWVYGRSTGLSAVAVVAAAVFWTWLWGFVGLLLATPLTVCFVVLGRYIPQLQFLDILLGNRPVLSPEETLYQRLLARDPEEATEQAEEFARKKSLAAFFDEVAIPAIVMAQIDSDRGVLSAHRRAIVADGFATILDNLSEDEAAEPEPPDGEPAPEAPAIACLAGRNELDLAVASLLQHLLRARGHRTLVLAPDAMASFPPDGRPWRVVPGVARLPLKGVQVVCLSLLSTNSAARARYLVRRVRRRARETRLLVGLWGHGAGDYSPSEITAASGADQVVTTLAAAIAEIEAALHDAQYKAAAKLPEQRTRQPA
jgi:predicted PurR-regulated permease PerM